MKQLTSEQTEALKVWDEREWWPTRALAWVWYTMPKRKRNDEGGWERTEESDRFPWLRIHRDDYFRFLAEHNLKKNTYDKYIGVFEKEERTSW